MSFGLPRSGGKQGPSSNLSPTVGAGTYKGDPYTLRNSVTDTDRARFATANATRARTAQLASSSWKRPGSIDFKATGVGF